LEEIIKLLNEVANGESKWIKIEQGTAECWLKELKLYPRVEDGITIMMARETFDDVKELVIRLRQYIVQNDLLMGECAAWNQLKKVFHVAQDRDGWEKDLEWYKQRRDQRIRSSSGYQGQ
jgi:hypothetical protein